MFRKLKCGFELMWRFESMQDFENQLPQNIPVTQ